MRFLSWIFCADAKWNCCATRVKLALGTFRALLPDWCQLDRYDDALQLCSDSVRFACWTCTLFNWLTVLYRESRRKRRKLNARTHTHTPGCYVRAYIHTYVCICIDFAEFAEKRKRNDGTISCQMIFARSPVCVCVCEAAKLKHAIYACVCVRFSLSSAQAMWTAVHSLARKQLS